MKPYPLALILVAALGCSRLPREVEHARDLFQHRAYDQARAAAKDALRRFPEHPVLWRVTIRSAAYLGEPETAMAAYTDWVRIRKGHDPSVLEQLALTTLWQAMRVPSAPVQTRAIQAIERLEIERFARDVEDRMVDDNDTVAAAAAVALLRSRFGAPEIATQLLSSDHPEARAIAVEGIGRKIGKRAQRDLRFALGDRDARVRMAGIYAIAAMDHAADTPKLIALATQDPDPEVRATALQAVAGRRHREGAKKAAERALMDPSETVRVAAVHALHALGDSAALERVVSTQRATEDPVLAVHALAALHPGQEIPHAQAALTRAMAHASWHASAETRARMAPILRHVLPRARAIEALDALLEDPAPLVAVAAASALAYLLPARGIDRLATACRRQNPPEARAAAIQAHLEHRQLSLGLVSLLFDDSALGRVQAAEVILQIL